MLPLLLGLHNTALRFYHVCFPRLQRKHCSAAEVDTSYVMRKYLPISAKTFRMIFFFFFSQNYYVERLNFSSCNFRVSTVYTIPYVTASTVLSTTVCAIFFYKNCMFFKHTSQTLLVNLFFSTTLCPFSFLIYSVFVLFLQQTLWINAICYLTIGAPFHMSTGCLGAPEKSNK